MGVLCCRKGPRLRGGKCLHRFWAGVGACLCLVFLMNKLEDIKRHFGVCLS